MSEYLAVEVADRLEDRRLELARRIVANAPLALRAAKSLRVRLGASRLTDGMAMAEAIRGPLDDTEDCVEGLEVFRERRPARYKGR